MRVTQDLPSTSLDSGRFQPLPGFDTQGMKNYAGQQLKELGDAQTKAALAMTAIGMAYLDEVHTANAKNADNKGADLIRLLLMDAKTGFLARQGMDAVNSRKDAVKSLNDGMEAIESGLGSKIERFMFKRAAAVRLQQAMNEIDGHTMRESRSYNVAETRKGLEGAMSDGLHALDADPASWRSPGIWDTQYGLSRRLMEDKVHALAELHGIPERDDKGEFTSLYQDLRQTALTEFHSQAVGNMIGKGLASEAKAYYDAMKESGEISEAKAGNLGYRLRLAVAASNGDNLADEIFGQWVQSGKSDHEAIPVYDLEAKTGKLTGDDEDVRVAAIAGIRDRAVAFSAQRIETRAQNIANIWKMADVGMTLKNIMSSPEWANLSRKDHYDIMMTMEDESLEHAAMESPDAGAPYMKNGDYYLTCSNPDVLKSMSRTQVEALRGTLGKMPTSQLLARWDAVRDPDMYREACVEKKLFDDAARELQLGTDSTDRRNRETKAMVGAFRFYIDQEIAQEEASRKNAMTNSEKKTFIIRTLAKAILTQ